MKRIQHGAFSFAIVLGMLCGCGERGVDGRPTPVPVSGTVLYNQQPCADAQVVFAPQDHNHAAVGKSDSSGRFVLQTFEPGDGAVPGRFRVVVTKFEAIDTPDGGFKETFFLPQKYRDAETSGLTAVVATDGANDIQLELVD
ncbi:MAG: hypothetical protein AB7F89_02805 [Pirellulaceae bacterium]